MAWPNSRLLDFIDNSTPYVSAEFLNAIQDEIIANRFTWAENWCYNPAENPGAGYGPVTTYLPDHRWMGVAAVQGVNISDPSADFPWSNVVFPTGGGPYNNQIITAGQLWRAHATQTLVAECVMQHVTIGVSAYSWDFGFAEVSLSAGQAAVIQIDSPASAFWQCKSHDGVGLQTTVTSVAHPVLSTTRVKLRVEIVGTTSCRFYIDDVLVATHLTRVPTTTPLALQSAFNSPGANSQSLRLGPVRMGYR